MPTLAAAEERWRLTIDNAPVGIALVGLDGTFIRVNDALCRILRRSAEELMSLTFQDITHPDDLEADLVELERLLAGEVPTYRMRKRYLAPDGEEISTELSVSLARNAAGEPLHLVSHIADRSEELAAAARIEKINRDLQEQTAKLERSNADLEAFATLASHDLQAPLTAVRGYLELLTTEHADALDDQAREWLDRASQAAERMSTLLSSLLHFSRATGEDTTERTPVSVAGLVEEVTHDLAPMMSETSTVVEVTGEDLEVLGHGPRLRQVLQNLVQNAIKYRHPDRAPHVVVSVETREEDWVVTVADNAAGVPDAQKSSVFGMFTRLGDHEDRPPGHGIGLAATRRIVERHGGEIWVEDNEGGGSRFRFTLPR